MEHFGWLMPVLKVVRGFWRWVVNTVRLPGRIERLEKAQIEGVADPRPTCTACGKGRVAVTDRLRGEQSGFTVGTCDACGAEWQVSHGGDRLVYFRKAGHTS